LIILPVAKYCDRVLCCIVVLCWGILWFQFPYVLG